MSLLSKLKEMISKTLKTQEQIPIEYHFDYTGYEDLTSEDLTRMFKSEIFCNTEQAEQMRLIQEQVNRITKQLGLQDQLYVNITQQTENNIDLEGNNIKVNPDALGSPIMLYVQIAGIMERAHQVEIARNEPKSPIGIQLNNPSVQLRTGFTYDHSSITPMQGSGSLRFPPTICTDLKVKPIYYTDAREQQKAFSHDYYMSRFQPTERAIARSMESAWKDIKLRLDEDRVFDGPSRANLNYTKIIIGDYDDDLKEYIARTGIPEPEKEIDRFFTMMASGSKKPYQGATDIIDTDIKLASIHAYNTQHNIPFRIADDPRIMKQFKHSPAEFARMSDSELRSFFYPSNWHQLALEEKKMLLQEQCNRETKELGLQRKYTVLFENIHDGSCAFYRQGEDKVHFDLSQINGCNPIYLYSTIPHELIHARQNEIAQGLIVTTPEEQAFNANIWNVKTNITTPSEFHGQPIVAINGEIVKDMARTEFTFMDSHEVSAFSARRVDEASRLYRLQPIEREAFEHQEHKYDELEQQMTKDGKLDKYSKMIFDLYRQNRIATIESLVSSTYGCPNPTEAIKQFQAFTHGLITDYDPQTADFDFALRFQAISMSTYSQFKVYPTDPRDAILKQESLQTTADLDSPKAKWLMPGEVNGRMSQEEQLHPSVYVNPLSDEVHTVERKKGLSELNEINKEINNGSDKDDLNNDGGRVDDEKNDRNIKENDTLNEKDKQFIMDALGEPPKDEIIQDDKEFTNSYNDEEEFEI